MKDAADIIPPPDPEKEPIPVAYRPSPELLDAVDFIVSREKPTTGYTRQDILDFLVGWSSGEWISRRNLQKEFEAFRQQRIAERAAKRAKAKGKRK